MLDSNRVMEPHHAHLSHIFVHFSYDHLLSNLANVWLFGYPICSELGAHYMNVLFLSGGVVSSLPFDVYINKWYQKQPPSLTTSVMRNWNRLVKDVGLSRTVLLCGSSGACAALLGNTFVYLCDRLIKVGYSMIRQLLDDSEKSSVQLASQQQRSRYAEIIKTSMGIAYFASSMYREILSMQIPKETFDLSFFDMSSSVLVNHTAHVQGFVYGCAFALGGMLLKRWRWWPYCYWRTD
jgi:membrane associated rhomboid family serine protease